ncbi:hypothetical protein LIER_33663 [Lithospermum erythrorhizon]|uniref:Uncharacterized protein n=1 Tax=Lithospermum erythrorhizon TaxID=34254 RepID=A0AAV3S0K6_LITER
MGAHLDYVVLGVSDHPSPKPGGRQSDYPAAYTPLYRGCAAKWHSLRSSNSERNRRWSSLQENVLHLKGLAQESSDPPRGWSLAISPARCIARLTASPVCTC